MIAVATPAAPPRLTPRAARALLAILREHANATTAAHLAVAATVSDQPEEASFHAIYAEP
jgi:hypothetical protein